MPPIHTLLFFFTYLLTIVSSASNPTSFCKCICGANSTIIPLDAPPSSRSIIPRTQTPSLLTGRKDDAPPADDKGEQNQQKGEGGEKKKEYRKKTCKRDSRKDEAVVFIFIFATAGLLGWAAVKPWVGGWIDSARERRTYVPVSGEGDGLS
ncbi:MAG: hypothetical protein Q9171_004387 [Xanthocarpia ochracea]